MTNVKELACVYNVIHFFWNINAKFHVCYCLQFDDNKIIQQILCLWFFFLDQKLFCSHFNLKKDTPFPIFATFAFSKTSFMNTKLRFEVGSRGSPVRQGPCGLYPALVIGVWWCSMQCRQTAPSRLLFAKSSGFDYVYLSGATTDVCCQAYTTEC